MVRSSNMICQRERTRVANHGSLPIWGSGALFLATLGSPLVMVHDWSVGQYTTLVQTEIYQQLRDCHENWYTHSRPTEDEL